MRLRRCHVASKAMIKQVKKDLALEMPNIVLPGYSKANFVSTGPGVFVKRKAAHLDDRKCTHLGDESGIHIRNADRVSRWK